jgi:hypothetical protein
VEGDLGSLGEMCDTSRHIIGNRPLTLPLRLHTGLGWFLLQGEEASLGDPLIEEMIRQRLPKTLWAAEQRVVKR